MKKFIYILVFLLISGCGARKKQSSKEFELSKKLTSNEILETSKDTLSFQKWSWLQKSSFKLSPEDPEQPSSFQFDEKTNTVNFQNAVIEGKEENEVNQETNLEGKETTLDKSTNDETTDITGKEAQSESREQWKLKVWHLAPFLALIGVVYLIINHRTIIFNFLKRKLSKFFNS